MKYIIAGGRDFKNFGILKNTCSKFTDIDTVISGCAQGADMLGAEWALAFKIPIQTFPAYWNIYGKTAGFIRNAEMAENADALIAFWDQRSKGTEHMIKTMKKQNKPYWVYNYHGELIEHG